MRKTKTVQICDACHHEATVFETCPVCKREICYSCRRVSTDVFSTEVCGECFELPKVAALIKRYLESWRRSRQRILSRLSRIKPKQK